MIGFDGTATMKMYTLSLNEALPIKDGDANGGKRIENGRHRSLEMELKN